MTTYAYARPVRIGLPGRTCPPGARVARLRGKLHFMFKKAAWRVAMKSALIFKRAFDVAVSGFALVLTSPIFLLTALAIRLEDGGPVFFSQTRVGKWGREFPCWKFRSMVKDAEALKAKLMAQNESTDGVLFKMTQDPRITRVGRFIRRYSIDEFPQFYNVFRGDMSIVGPRPPVPKEVALYTLGDRRRLDVKPGITCIWQVSGRSQIPFKQQVRLDVQYIESQSIAADLKILFRTIPAVLLGKGAY